MIDLDSDLDLVEKAEELIRSQGDQLSSTDQARLGTRKIDPHDACPYISGCTLPIQGPETCIGKGNYQVSLCYSTFLALDNLNGRFDSLEPTI